MRAYVACSLRHRQDTGKGVWTVNLRELVATGAARSTTIEGRGTECIRA
jgi:hypothetical protein